VRRASIFILAPALLALLASAAGITEQTLRNAQSDAATWLTYGKNYSGWRYADIGEINRGNVSKLSLRWIFQTGVTGKFEATPLFFGRLLYATGVANHAYAIDALTGRPIWHYEKPVPAELNLCCGQVNRGFAALGDKLFKVNLEAKLVALDAKTGTKIWETTIDDFKKGYSETVAPLVVKNLVVVGVAGAEFGVRGFIDAYDADSGKRVWRFWTVAAEGEKGGDTWAADSWKRGGGSTWITGTYDPALNLIYWGTGNPGPDLNGDDRKGDNLYTCSLVALDADTGKLKWHYQFTPHDVHDWDAVADPALLDVKIGGKAVKAVVHANRNGLFYAFDRATGKLLVAKSFTKVSWTDGVGPDGRPHMIAGQDPTEEGNKSCPGMGGGHNWQATAYSPRTGLYYFTSTDGCQIYYKTKQDFIEGEWFQGSTNGAVPGEPTTGSILAVNPGTGETKWRMETVTTPSSGLLATAGGLVFAGDREGYLMALDAESGKVLWKFQTGGPVGAPPISYLMDGKQYVVVAAGAALMAFALP
jgi:alcohol dehydrogenase (cytochrome c)